MSEQQWYYRKGGKRGGPVTGSELRRMATDGELAPGDSVRGVGMTEWLPAGDFEALFPKPDPVKRKVDAIFGDLAPKPSAAPPLPAAPPPSMAPPARRGAPPVPPPVPHSMQPQSVQPSPSYGAVDQGNPYAGFGMNPPGYTTAPNPYAPSPYATVAAPNPYSPVAAMNQQDILAAEAARAVNDAAARAAWNQNPYSAASAYGSAPRSGASHLQTIASLRRWMFGTFWTKVVFWIIYAVLMIGYITPGIEAGGELSARGAMLIAGIYLIAFVSEILSIIYICRLAYHLGKSVILYFAINFIPCGQIIALVILNGEATARLRGARY